jgi:hypothetical protein
MGTQADNVTGNAQVVLADWHRQGAGYLGGLPDPAFFALWATVRDWLAYTPAGKPCHSELKRLYDAVSAEFRQRLEGGPGSAS